MSRRFTLLAACLCVIIFLMGSFTVVLSETTQNDRLGEDNYTEGRWTTYQSILYGDMNGDGQVTNVDLILLRRYIAGITIENFNPDAADVNGDGYITNIDLILLNRYLVGILDILGPANTSVNIVIDMINAIGEPPEQLRVDEARSAYDALSEEQKVLVTNYQKLLDAEEPLIRMAESAVTAYEASPIGTMEEVEAAEALELAANERIALVSDVGQKEALEARVAAKKTVVDTARTEFEAEVQRQADAQANVTAYEQAPLDTWTEVLGAELLGTEAEAKTLLVNDSQVRADLTARITIKKADVEAAKVTLGTSSNLVIEIIAGLNNQSPTFADDVAVARAAYNALTPGQKALVTNYSDLAAAEKALEERFLRDDSIIRIESFSRREFYVHHSSAQRAKVDPVINPIEDSYFRLVPGLANSNLVSIESVNHPGSFLRSKNGEIWLDSNNGTNSFKGDATWYKRNGLSDATGVSFESYNNSGQYIRNNNKLLIIGSASTNSERKTATFYVQPNYSAYVMGYFKESPGGQDVRHALQLAYSYDAMNWVSLNQNNPVLTPTLGERGLRDPFILRKQDGTFIILGTNMWTSDYIHAFDSPDLIKYNNGRLLRLRIDLPGTHPCAWAPKAIWDPSRQQYGIYWSIHKNRTRVNYTPDFNNVGNPQVFFDPGHWVIDAAFIRYDDKNYLYYKDERDSNDPSGHGMRIKGAWSNSLEPGSFNNNLYSGPYGPPPLEGPMPVQVINENRWVMYTDNYFPANGVFYAFETTDLASGNWTEMNRKNYNQPISSKHGSIVKVTRNELDKLIAHYGNPQWNRLKSYNKPRQYIRHANGIVRLDQYPIDPVRNTMWKIVPGLADSNGISFESIDHPGNFLRHANFILRLDANNNTQAFKEDATFYKEPGLAEPSWSSFKSYNYPDLYIRNTILEMRIDTITDNASKEAATYKIEY